MLCTCVFQEFRKMNLFSLFPFSQSVIFLFKETLTEKKKEKKRKEKQIYRFFTGASVRSLLRERVHHGVYRFRLAAKILLAMGHQIRILADFVQPI